MVLPAQSELPRHSVCNQVKIIIVMSDLPMVLQLHLTKNYEHQNDKTFTTVYSL